MAEYVQPDITLIGDSHVEKYRETDGEVGYLWNGAPCLLLTVVGLAVLLDVCVADQRDVGLDVLGHWVPLGWWFVSGGDPEVYLAT